MTQQKTSRRAIVSVSGPDAATLLGGLLTNETPSLENDAVFAALLTPQGKVLFDFIIVKSGDGFLFDLHAESAPAFVKRLTLYRLRAKVEIKAEETLSVGLGAAPAGSTVYADPRHPELPQRFITEHAADESDWTAFDAARLSLGIPEAGLDFEGDELFPMDLNYDLINGVDYKKGCFVGQEVASRMKRKADARKRTLIASFDGAPPERGAPITAEGSTLGHVMSGATGAALALVRLDRWEVAKEEERTINCEGRELHLALPAYLASL